MENASIRPVAVQSTYLPPKALEKTNNAQTNPTKSNKANENKLRNALIALGIAGAAGIGIAVAVRRGKAKSLSAKNLKRLNNGAERLRLMPPQGQNNGTGPIILSSAERLRLMPPQG